MKRWLAMAALEWAAIAAAIYAATLSPWLWVPALVVIGTRQHALAVLGHDAAHFVVPAWAGCLFALWPLGMGLYGYRRFHFGHHMHVGTKRDTELEHQKRFPAKWSADNLQPRRRAYLLATDALGFGLFEVLTVLAVAYPVRRSDWLGPTLTIVALSTACIALGASYAPLLWYASLYTAFWASFRQRCLEEHVGEAPTRIRTRTPALWQRLLYLPHHIWKHAQHHRFPSMDPALL